MAYEGVGGLLRQDDADARAVTGPTVGHIECLIRNSQSTAVNQKDLGRQSLSIYFRALRGEEGLLHFSLHLQ